MQAKNHLKIQGGLLVADTKQNLHQLVSSIKQIWEFGQEMGLIKITY